MIKSEIIHPQLLASLARSGHKAQILVADANYSFVTNSSARAEIVYLNFAPGMVPSTNILAGVCKLINVEHARMMAWPDDFDNAVHKDYVDILPDGTSMDFVSREEFETVKAMAQKAREQADALEAKVAALEAKLSKK